ncbi:MAG: LptA/OstA family protein [Myxococcota bacterium]|nr:LptA/OstA family protein [Myxococcota bacterium]
MVVVPVVVAGAAVLLSGCAERASAEPREPPRVEARDVAIAASRADGGAVRIEAESAVLSPDFPAEISGTFENAVAAVETPAPADGGAADAQGAAEPLAIRARRMRYDSRADRASFSGGVELIMGALALTCESLEVVYRRADGVADFTAAGSVRIRRTDLLAAAGRAEYRGADRVLVLTESPRVEGSLGTIEGSRIVLALGEDTVTVEEVRGRLRIR